jgi:hypothetical protein
MEVVDAIARGDVIRSIEIVNMKTRRHGVQIG